MQSNSYSLDMNGNDQLMPTEAKKVFIFFGQVRNLSPDISKTTCSYWKVNESVRCLITSERVPEVDSFILHQTEAGLRLLYVSFGH